jgi:predicted nucleotidyltransferase
MTLEPDFNDFILLLNKHEVEYLVVGGYAMAFHGRPRYTGDLDIWIDISKSNAEKMLVVLRDFGFASLPFTEDDFLRENIINQIGYPPLRIDILTSIDGITFLEAYSQRKVLSIEGLEVKFIWLKQLIKNKLASNRAQDIADVEALSPTQGLPPEFP